MQMLDTETLHELMKQLMELQAKVKEFAQKIEELGNWANEHETKHENTNPN